MLKIEGDELCGVRVFTSTEVSRLTGFHAPRVLCLMTEAQALEDFCWEAMLATATGADSKVLALGNPLFNSGKFFAVARSPQWQSLAIPASEHPNIVAGREVIPGSVTREWVERMAAEYGRESQIYRSRVLAEFPDDSLESLVKREWLEAAAARWEALDPSRVQSKDHMAALDVARFGPDRSALALRVGPLLRAVMTWTARDTMETCGLVLEQLSQHGVPLHRGEEDGGLWAIPGLAGLWPLPQPRTRTLIVDEIGLGAGVLDRLKEQGFEVSGFNGSRTPRAAADEHRFANERAACYWHLRELLEAGQITLPRDKELFDELSATQWKVSSSGKVQIEDKGELSARLGRSPDKADAVAMCYADFGRSRALDPSEWAVYQR
jgi:hypothetical protein